MEDLSEEEPDEEKKNEAIDKSRQILKQRNVFRKLRENKLKNATKRLMNEGRKRSTSFTQSEIDFLEKDSDSESEKEDKKEDDKVDDKAETKAEDNAEPKPESKRKKDSKENKEEKHIKLLSSLTSDMLEKGIEILEKEKKYYSKKPPNHVISKEGAKSLNKSLNEYGLNFRTNTSIATVVKKLEEHIARLDNHYGVGKMKGQLADLRTNEEKVENKKSSYIDA